MIYHPDVDLTKVEISYDNTFYYISIYLSDVNPTNNTLNAWYGVEFDTDLDGRGDYFLWAKGTDNIQWNIEEVYVFTDINNDVGGYQPLKENAPNYAGDSYETILFSPQVLTDPDTAWGASPSYKSISHPIGCQKQHPLAALLFSYGVVGQIMVYIIHRILTITTSLPMLKQVHPIQTQCTIQSRKLSS